MKKKRKILLIDDNKGIREVFAALLENRGYEVVLADNGEKGIMMMESGNFEAVLTDREMPKMLGEEVVRYIKMNYPGTKVILMSGNLDTQVTAVARAAGADLVIMKSSETPKVVHNFLMGGK